MSDPKLDEALANGQGRSVDAVLLRPADDLSIPPELDRTKGLTKEQIDAQRDKTIKNAKKPTKAKKALTADGHVVPKGSNLTETDKKNIAELEKTIAAKKTEKKIASLNKLRESKGLPPIKTKKPKVAGEPKKGSKTALIADLLKRKEGCTTAEILKVADWPSVSVPAMAKLAGLTLRKEKIGKVTRYWGS